MTSARDENVGDRSPTFTPVRMRRGYQEIVDQIRGEIVTGKLNPGDRLPNERDLAQLFGVARQSVREAIRVLEMSGLVEVRVGVNGGAYISSGDVSVVTQGLGDLAFFGHLSSDSLLEARILVTSEAVRLVCARGTEADFARLEQDIARTEALTATGDRRGRTSQIVTFYRILAEATHNEVYALLSDALTDIVQVRLAAVDPPPLETVTQSRRRIVDAMRRGDDQGAVDELVGHLQRLEAFLAQRESTPQAAEEDR